MKQVLQNLGTGRTEIIETPCPQIQHGHVLIKTLVSLISTGTERAAISQSKQGLTQKVIQQPQKLKKAWDLFKTEGLETTIGAIKKQLDFPISMGYSNVGVVIGLGPGVYDLQVGDRVLSNGPHCEIVNVPKNLCAKVPEKVSDDTAAFAVLSSIGLQGVRLIEPTIGETMAVMGLGVIGLLTVQILKAGGCQVIALDPNPERVKIAEKYGAVGVCLASIPSPVDFILDYTDGVGVDGVIITAATDSNAPIEHSASMCRKRGRIVLTGVTGLNIDRNLFYQKELSFQVSCSYGPGRYDESYEQKGLDYPLAFVRWTEKRNFTACLQLMSEGKINTSSLHSETFAITDIAKAYKKIHSEQPPLTVLIDYPQTSRKLDTTVKLSVVKSTEEAKCNIAVIGVGNYSKTMIIPTLKQLGANIVSLSSQNGLSATLLAKKLNISESTTDLNGLFTRKDINCLIIATRHNTHSEIVCAGLKNDKHLFVEKPLCLTMPELTEITEAYNKNSMSKVLVGYNRRFSPHIQKISSSLIENKAPRFIQMNINAGFIPQDHWIQNPGVGGGRLIGEACHFIDLSRFLANSKIKSISAKSMKASHLALDENFCLTLQFENGSIASISYYANGVKTFAKEYIQVSQSDSVYQINDFKSMSIFNKNGETKSKLRKQDKGQNEMFTRFIYSIEKGSDSPIPFEQIIEVAGWTLKARKILI